MDLKTLLNLFLFTGFIFASHAQQIEAQFVVNADFVNQTNQQIFETLEQSVNEFINTKDWTGEEINPEERVQCTFVLNLTGFSGSSFEGTLQVQVERPVFNSNFNTPVFNFLDKDIRFVYQEYQPFFYNPATYESNLISLLSFYVFFALGVEADTFAPNAGSPYYKVAQQIVNLAQQNGQKGWNQNDGNRNRFWLIDTVLSNTFKEYRSVQYSYHREGMDQMYENPEKAKIAIIKALEGLTPLFSRRPNAFLIQTFFDAKSDEIVDVFSGGPAVDTRNLTQTLNQIAPFFGPKWKRIKS